MEEISKKERDFLRVGVQEAYLCAEFVSKYLDDEKKKENLAIMQGLVNNYCTMDHVITIRPSLVSKMKTDEEKRLSQLENAETSADGTEVNYSEVLSSKVNSNIKKFKVENHDKAKWFKKKVSKLLGQEDDDDLAVTEEQTSYIDPISKQQLVDPVITLKCQHRFSRKNIMQQLEGKYETRCPYVGCKEKFSPDDIEEDVLTACTLRRMQLQDQM